VPDTVVVEIDDARKHYRNGRRGSTRALDGLDLRVERGSVHALLGPNGAGKSTTVGAVATLTALDSGRVRVAGHDVRTEAGDVRRSIGLVTQAPALDEALHADENLVVFGRLHDLGRGAARRRADELLRAFGLEDARHRKVSTFSGGMRRRLDIAAALVRRPALLVLDEPTSGLDPRARLEVWSTIRSVVAEGTTVLLTTQHLDEADQLADRITLLNEGRVTAEGTPDELKDRLSADRVVVTVADPALTSRAAMLLGGQPAEPGVVHLDVAGGDPVAALVASVRALDEHRLTISGIALRRPTLDEVFLALTATPPDRSSPETPSARSIGQHA
jgi:ABC-2 type transport system ATP-binding protein